MTKTFIAAGEMYEKRLAAIQDEMKAKLDAVRAEAQKARGPRMFILDEDGNPIGSKPAG